jgi:putative ABC transport system permease protein
MNSRWVTRLIALYPALWRHRYGLEFEDFLRYHPPGVRGVMNIVLAAIGEHVRFVTDGGFAQDVRCAFRSLRRRPSFSTLAVVTLALGIGGATASFSLVNGILLKPLPYRDPERIVSIWTTNPARQGQPNWDHSWFSYPEYEDIRLAQTSFEEVALTTPANPRSMLSGSEPQQIQVAAATWTLFPLLGTQAQLGRIFTSTDDRPDTQRTIVLSHALWQQAFGGDPGVVGKNIDIDEFFGVRAYTIVGVLPPGFRFKSEGFAVSNGRIDITIDGVANADAWIPAALSTSNLRERGDHSFTMTARLKPNVSIETAQAEVARLVPGTGESQPGAVPHVHGARVASRYQQETRSSSGPLWILFAVSGLLLVIACGNVSNLLLGEIAVREQEIAVRAALGAGWLRILRQLVTESLLLSFLGAILGLPIAMWSTRTIVLLAPVQLPRMDEVHFDIRVFAFALLIACIAAATFGVAPALTIRRSKLARSVRESSGRIARRTALQRCIVAGEITLSFVLLVSAGLLVRSFQLLSAVDPGFKSRNLLVVRAAPPLSRFRGRLGSFNEEALRGLRALPGVSEVSGVNIQPFGPGVQSNYVQAEGLQMPPGQLLSASRRVILPDYFNVAGIPVLLGRSFTEADNVPATDSVIVNRVLAHRFWPDQNPIDRRVFIQNKWFRIVGVVSDVRDQGLRRETEMAYYIPAAAGLTNLTFVIRTEGPPLVLAAEVKQVFWSIDKSITFPLLDSSDNLIAASLAEDRYRTLLIGIFAAAAALLAAIGLYGVIAQSVSHRIRELGIRIALGAGPRKLVIAVMTETMHMTTAGIVLGLAISMAVTRIFSQILFGVQAIDLPIYVVCVGFMLVISVLASWAPVRRAVRIDPIVALRFD